MFRKLSKADEEISHTLHTLLGKSDFAVERDFPHVFHNIILNWNTEGFHKYVSTLVLDTPTEDRPDRRSGFPIHIMREILEFSKLHNELNPEFNRSNSLPFTY